MNKRRLWRALIGDVSSERIDYAANWITLACGDIVIAPDVVVRGSRVAPRDPRPAEQDITWALRQLFTYPVPVDARGEQMKYCSDCGEWRALDKFSPDKRNRDGKQSYCKACQAERMRRVRQARRAG